MRSWLCLLLFSSVPAAGAPAEVMTYLSPRTQAPALKMHLWKPECPQPCPVVLLVHGGGFRNGAPEEMQTVAEQLRTAGFAAAAVSYRLTPRFQFPAQLQDLKAAVRYLRANASRLGLDATRVCVAGEEAGATLALLLGFTPGVSRFEGRPEHREFSSSVNCVVSRDPLASGPPAWTGSTDDRGVTLPENWITPDAAAVFSIRKTSQRSDARSLSSRLKAVGVEAIDTTSDAKELPNEAISFLRRHLVPAPDRFTLLLSDHGPAAELVAMGWPSGKVLWKVSNGAGLDVHALPNGHVLFTNHAAHKVVELDARQKEIWSLGPEAGLATPYSVRRLSNGNTLIGDAKFARVTEFTPQGTVAWKWERPDLIDLWPRMSRPTAAGTTLVTFQKAGIVFEVDRAGKVIWEQKLPSDRLPYQALRLPNGNTLVGLVDPGEVVELDRSGRTVRSIGGDGSGLRLSWIAGMDVLPSGGVVLADFTAGRVVEVDAQGRLVHELRNLPWSIASIAVMAPR